MPHPTWDALGCHSLLTLGLDPMVPFTFKQFFPETSFPTIHSFTYVLVITYLMPGTVLECGDSGKQKFPALNF